jgi:hypothetical protein
MVSNLPLGYFQVLLKLPSSELDVHHPMVGDSDVGAFDSSCALRGHPFGPKTMAVTHRYAVVTIRYVLQSPLS